MRFVRAILALMIAWSVAMAPTIGISAVVSSSTGRPVQAVPASEHAGHHAQQGQQHHRDGGPAGVSGHADHADSSLANSCCHDADGSPPSNGPAPDDCNTMPGCALKSFNLAPVFGANLAVPGTLSTRLSWHRSPVILPNPLAPPLRPPRS